MSLRVKTGTSGIYASLLTIDGTTLNTTAYEKIGRKTLKIRRFPIDATGRYVLLLENTNGSTEAAWSGKVKAKPTKRLKEKMSFGPRTGEIEIPFSVLRGAKITLTAAVAGRDAPVAELVEIVDADGNPLDVRAYLVLKRTGFKLVKLPISEAGDYRIRIRPDDTGSADGVLKIQLRVKSPKEYSYSAD